MYEHVLSFWISLDFGQLVQTKHTCEVIPLDLWGIKKTEFLRRSMVRTATPTEERCLFGSYRFRQRWSLLWTWRAWGRWWWGCGRSPRNSPPWGNQQPVTDLQRWEETPVNITDTTGSLCLSVFSCNTWLEWHLMWSVHSFVSLQFKKQDLHHKRAAILHLTTCETLNVVKCF